MKKITALFFMAGFLQNIHAQTGKVNYTVQSSNVPINESNINTATIPLHSTTHFVSPEPIEYVDISSPDIQGDLPEKNIFRLRADTDKIHPGDKFTVTIVTQSYISVYKLTVAGPQGAGCSNGDEAYVISVNPNDAVRVNQADALSNQECFDLAIKAMNLRQSIFNIDGKAYGMKMYVKNIYTIGDYIMIELAAKNKTNLEFDIDQIRFKIIDKHTVKAAVSQEIELKPVYSLYSSEGKIISHGFNNFYIFKKFTYPTQKLLKIEMTEKQYSGRRVDLKINYNEILNARQLN